MIPKPLARVAVACSLAATMAVGAIAATLVWAQADDFEAAVAKLKSPDSKVRGQAAWSLGARKDPRGTSALVIALIDSNPQVRDWAAWSLGEIQDRQAVKPLGTAVTTDADANVRTQAVKALGAIGDPAAAAPLRTALGQDADVGVRVQAAWSLGRLKDPRAIEWLAAALTDDSPAVRSAAVSGLAKIGRPAGAVLSVAFRHPGADVRREVTWALVEIGHPDAASLVAGALSDSSASVRARAAEMLEKLRDPTTVPALVAAVRDESAEVRRNVAAALHAVAVPSAIDGLGQAMSDTDSSVRQQAVYGLGRIADRHDLRDEDAARVVSFFVAALRDDSPYVRSGAARTLSAGSQRVVLALVEHFRKNPATLALIYDDVIDLGIDALLDTLVDSLERHGNKRMAEVFLNAGHARLEQAARDWARRRGYQIVPAPPGGNPRWGKDRRP
jgi:HEAT repeat protein